MDQNRMNETPASGASAPTGMTPRIEFRAGEWLVWAEDKTDGYVGPCAHIYGDKHFVHLCTDTYEGHAMINTEALPLLIQALSSLQAQLTPDPDAVPGMNKSPAPEEDGGAG